MVAGLAAAAAAAGKTWDPTLVPPRAAGAPPAGAITPLRGWLGWGGKAKIGPAPAALVGFCADRPRHHITPPGAPAIPWGQHVCSSALNPVPLPVAPPGQLPVPLAADYLRTLCPLGVFPNASHGPGHDVCLYCRDHTTWQNWFQSIWGDVSLPPVVGPAQSLIAGGAANLQPLATYRRFQTLLCGTCQDKEITLYYHRTNATPGFVLPPAVTRQMENYPQITCTCKYWLDMFAGDRLCVEHRHTIATTAHNILLVTRQQNDHWLRNLGKSGGRLKTCHGNTRNARARNGVYRACRCGANIESPPLYGAAGPNYPPPVFMCLGCEGVEHTIEPPGDPARPPPLPQLPPITNINTRGIDTTYPLRRIDRTL